MRRRTEQPQQFVILPTRGLRATQPTSSPNLTPFLAELATVRTVAAARSFVASEGLRVKPDFKILDSIHEDGAKLVEMTADTAKDLLAAQPGLRIVPVVYYRLAIARPEIQAKVKATATARKTVITVLSKGDNKPVRAAEVIAFTDFANGFGAEGKTNAEGIVKLSLGRATKIERLYVFTKRGFWGILKKNVRTSSPTKVSLTPVDLRFTDALRHFYGNAPDGSGAGVTVGVVDTGIGPHADLVVTGGLNTVHGEDANDFADNGDGHGTHVAGIIAARGLPPAGIRGIAPAISLRSYRVFGRGADGASNFAIAKAIDRAVADGCDIINLSLGGEESDPATQSAIHDARQAGSLVVAAAGNDDRGPVNFPAADPLCIAVSALGRKGTFPKGSSEEGDVLGPAGADRKDFIARFSNIGPETDLTAPGVGILSTVPGGYAPLGGTSMASPAAAGVIARRLAQLPAVLAMPRDQSRSDAIAKVLLQSAVTKGFSAEMEGKGMPLI
jgi:subtilisin